MSDPGQLDELMMERALLRAAQARLIAPPNPWVGATVLASSGVTFEGSTRRPGGPHAEIVALNRAGELARGSTMWVTLEPCNHHGRTGPCTEAIIKAGVKRVVVAVPDPDPNVSGSGVDRLRQAGILVDVGVGAEAGAALLAPYLRQRSTGRPYVVLKLAATADGATAAPDRTSKWITGPAARADAHRLRAESDAIVVGAGTVRHDNPKLTARDVVRPDGGPITQPLRVVLGEPPDDAAVQPCMSWTGELTELLEELGRRNVLQVMVEGGASVAHRFHHENLVDRYVLYLAPALMGGSDALSVLNGAGASTMAEVWRGSFDAVRPVGDDLRIDIVSARSVDAT